MLFAVELTGDFTLLTPLLIATGAAYAVTVLMLKRSILTEKIARKGQHIVREYSVDPFELLRVGEVMVRTVDTLPGTMRLEDAIAFFSADEPRHKSYPIESEDGRVVGMASRADILRWRREAPTDEDTLSDRLSDEALIVGYADETVAQLADRMAAEGVGRVAIVERGAMRLVGLISRKDLSTYAAPPGTPRIPGSPISEPGVRPPRDSRRPACRTDGRTRRPRAAASGARSDPGYFMIGILLRSRSRKQKINAAPNTICCAKISTPT